ncbi:hypothetical protein SS50377_26427 [Spironucleus salmonicida]|uniref:Uncharacterized protein n=1 Tax=Spironucleus salmonicida TaxID=348837 RepID=V6LVJ1_9EUKA|nr:hypothetical protein SS50377_26427 [Spironucleus salmonicida]|eukprot:EST47706.1 Hypothetical protein SS50377_12102 [Spironucleus salmonicida]
MRTCKVKFQGLFFKREYMSQANIIGSKIFVSSKSSSYKIDKADCNVNMLFSQNSVIYTDKKQRLSIEMSIENSLPIEYEQEEVIELRFDPNGIQSYRNSGVDMQ